MANISISSALTYFLFIGSRSASLNYEEGFRMCLDCRKSLPTFNCWSWDQDKKHFMNRWEIQKCSEPGFALELEAY